MTSQQTRLAIGRTPNTVASSRSLWLAAAQSMFQSFGTVFQRQHRPTSLPPYLRADVGLPPVTEPATYWTVPLNKAPPGWRDHE